MSSNILFQEKQRFNQWWLYLILVLPFGFMIYEVASGDINWTAIVIELIVLGLVFALIISTNLKTTVYENGIGYSFFPFVLKERVILWDEIKTIEVRQYQPLLEYGGWGLRYSLKNGRAYNIRGNQGLQLVLKNDKKILIGTQQPATLQQVLEKLKK